MKRLSLAVAAAAAGAAISLAGPASAVVMTATYTGTIDSGLDSHGTFFGGEHNQTLDGQAFTTVFVYDTTLGVRTLADGLDDRIRGGINAPGAGPSPMLSASMTINGFTFALPVGFDDNIRAQSEAFFLGFRPGLLTQSSFLADSTPDLDHQFSLNLGAFIATPASVEATQDLDLLTPGFGNFLLFDQDRLNPGLAADGSHAVQAFGRLTATHLTVVSDAAAVPEPAQWSLMILGFAATGALLRRRARAHVRI